MKKILIALFIGIISIGALSNMLNAQSSVPLAFNNSKHFRQSVRDMAALESLSNIGTYEADAKKVNAKAIKDFESRFDASGSAQWFSDQNGFVSYFIKGGYGNRVYYDKKGRWQYSLLFYSQDKLPRDIRAAVRSTYYDMDITLVQEVQNVNGMAYIIHLEDKSTIKILRVNKDGEMDTMQDLVKN